MVLPPRSRYTVQPPLPRPVAVPFYVASPRASAVAVPADLLAVVRQIVQGARSDSDRETVVLTRQQMDVLKEYCGEQ